MKKWWLLFLSWLPRRVEVTRSMPSRDLRSGLPIYTTRTIKVWVRR